MKLFYILFSVFLLVGLVSAGLLDFLDFSNEKTYNKIDKRLIIKDSSDNVLIDVKLTSSQKTWVTPGDDVKVAEFYLIDWDDKDDSFIEKIYSYDLKKDKLKKDKGYWYKYGIDNLVYECYSNFDEEEEEICDYNMVTDWVEFDKLKDLPHKNIKIGLFTSTFKGEHIEWVPTIKGFEITEWAEYELVGLSTYYDNSGEYSINEIRSLAISSDGNYLATSSYYNNYVSIMNITNKSEILPLATYYDIDGDYSVEGVNSILISPDGNYLITSSYLDHYVSIMDITDKTQILPLATYYDIDGDYSVEGVWSIAISSDGNYLATSSKTDDYVSIMNITDKTQILPLATYYDSIGDYSVNSVSSIAFSPDGNYLATSSFVSDLVSIMNITDKTQILPLATYYDNSGEYSVDNIYSLAISPDGNYLVVSSNIDDYVSIMNITDKTQILPLATYYDNSGEYSVDGIRRLVISPDGNYLATSSYSDDYVSIMDITDKTQILPLATYYGTTGDYSVDAVFWVAFSPDGNYLITSSNYDYYVSIMEIVELVPENCWTDEGTYIFIPDGCVYEINSGEVG